MNEAIFNRLSEEGINFCRLYPTETGLRKSIMDATHEVRSYFEAVGYHDYDTQSQGRDSKVLRDIFYIGESQRKTKVSLYRPKTKDGDPRIWFYGSKRHVSPNDCLLLVVYEHTLYVFNSTKRDLFDDLMDSESMLYRISSAAKKITPVAEELLNKLREIEDKGFIKTLKKGSTGVGYTLETLLGIPSNSSKQPDYKGIELKASCKNNRLNLFSRIPDWASSPMSEYEALMEFGYQNEEKYPSNPDHIFAPKDNMRLYHTISAKRGAIHGFMLDLDTELGDLRAIHTDPIKKLVFVWCLRCLKAQFLCKHNETFWITAEKKHIDGSDHYHYKHVTHTKNPTSATFERLLNEGGITVDLTTKVHPNAKTIPPRLKNHGFLFKVNKNLSNVLFPRVQEVDLAYLI